MEIGISLISLPSGSKCPIDGICSNSTLGVLAMRVGDVLADNDSAYSVVVGFDGRGNVAVTHFDKKGRHYPDTQFFTRGEIDELYHLKEE